MKLIPNFLVLLCTHILRPHTVVTKVSSLQVRYCEIIRGWSLMKRHFSWQLWLGMSGGHELHAGHQIEGSIKLISRGATVPDFFPEVPFSVPCLPR